MGVQVKKNHYQFGHYCGIDRWSSYWHQLDEIIKLSPRTVLEIGAGDQVVGSYLKNNTETVYECLDIDASLKPDHVGSVESINLPDNSYDLVCAFEVLEHLPFEKIERSLSEINRVAIDKAIISLPHWGRHFSAEIRLPYFKKIRFQKEFHFFAPKHEVNQEHYWEIGKKGYPVKMIWEKMRSAGFEVVYDFVVFESPYHHFFILKKKN